MAADIKNLSLYSDSAATLTAAADCYSIALTRLEGALRASTACSGSDEAGLSWARSHDEMSSQVLKALQSVPAALNTFALKMRISRTHHENADLASAGKQPKPYPQAPAAAFPQCSAAPSVSGGNGLQPDGFTDLMDYIHMAFPDADCGKLTSIDTAWTTMGTSVTELARDIRMAAQTLSGLHAPEKAAALEALASAEKEISSLAEACASLASSAREYREHVEKVQQEVLSAIEELAIAIGATIAVGVLLSWATAGLSAALSAAASTGEAAAAGTRIAIIIGRLAPLAARLSTSLKRVEVAVSSTSTIGRYAVTAVKTPAAGKVFQYAVVNSGVNVTMDAADGGSFTPVADISAGMASAPFGVAGGRLANTALKPGGQALAGRFAATAANNAASEAASEQAVAWTEGRDADLRGAALRGALLGGISESAMSGVGVRLGQAELKNLPTFARDWNLTQLLAWERINRTLPHAAYGSSMPGGYRGFMQAVRDRNDNAPSIRISESMRQSEPRTDGQVSADPAKHPLHENDPDVRNSDVRRLSIDNGAPYGRHSDGTAFSRGTPITAAEHTARWLHGPERLPGDSMNIETGSPRWPGNGGAVENSRITLEGSEEISILNGARLDRFGDEHGKYLGVQGDAFEERSLAHYSQREEYNNFTLDSSRIPEDSKVEIELIQPHFDLPGGGTQVRVQVQRKYLTVDGPERESSGNNPDELIYASMRDLLEMKILVPPKL